MKSVYLILVILHGFIHLLGFLKGFGIKEVKELTQPISKPMALLWLFAAVLFIAYGTLIIFDYKSNWIIGLVAVFISQSLIILFWQEAKAGTIANLIILIVIILPLMSSKIWVSF